MSIGLNCLIEDKKIIDRIKISLNNIANSMISKNADVKITAKDLYNKLKSVGIDIDLQSVASMYSEAFASSIEVYSNFETYDELKAYARETVKLKATTKQGLISAGFGKTLKNGKVVLDWVKLMRKEQSEIEADIKNEVIKSNKNLSETEIQTEIDNIYAALKGEWKQIIGNAIIKQQNILRNKNEPVTKKQKNAVDKIAGLYTEGLVSTFKDDYENALRKAVGVNSTNLKAMQLLDNLGKAANFVTQSQIGNNNHIGVILDHHANAIIAQAKYEDGNFVFKAASAVKGLYDFILLKILNNVFNRTENYISGAGGSLFTAVTYGMPKEQIKTLREQVKKDITNNGGADFGSVNNALQGERRATDIVRHKLNKIATGNENSIVGNWLFNQIMGVTSLHGIDSYRKVSNTWARFINGLEDILVSKGLTKQDAQKQLHEELFGKNKWENAVIKAKDFIKEANSKGGFQLPLDEQTAQRFAADIVKLELVESKLVTSNELEGAWNAGYRSAGREMGHVANNVITKYVTKLKEISGKDIDEAIKNKEYTKAAGYMMLDVIVNKIALRFVGGGSNWVILRLEKGGLGIVSGLAGRAFYNNSFNSKKNLSKLTPKEIEETLYATQKSNDKITRGTIGLLTNVLVYALAKIAIEGTGDDEEKRKRKRKLLDWLDKNYQAQKAINKIGFLYMGAYIALMQQEKIGYNDLGSKYKKQPIVRFAENLFNANPDYTLMNQAVEAIPYFTNPTTGSQEKKQEAGAFAMGKIMGNYFDLNPLPTQLIKSGVDIYKDIISDEPYVKPEFESTGDAMKQGYFKSGVLERLFKK